MIRLQKIIILLITSIFPILLFCSCRVVYQRNSEAAIIQKWADGDTATLRMDNGEEISARLYNIDTSETGFFEAGAFKSTEYEIPISYYYGEEAHKYVEDNYRVGEEVEVRIFSTDVYDRKVASLFYKGYDIQYSLIKEGLAIPCYWWIDNHYFRQNEYMEAMQIAITEQKGLWDFVYNPKFDLSIFNRKGQSATQEVLENSEQINRDLLKLIYPKWNSIRRQYGDNFLAKNSL